jgi:virulence factor Mce-like protein
MQKSAPTIGRVLTIAGFSLSCFGLLLFLWLAFGGSSPLKPKGYRFKASFTDAATLAIASDVRVAGVSVGRVVAKKRDPAGNRDLATIELKPKYAPLRSDARAVLRQKTLLGETYVELTLGDKHAPAIKEGGRLPNTAIEPAVEFDELLRTFDPATRKAFQQWQASSAAATRGRGQDLNDVLGSLPIFAESAQDVVDVLDKRQEALRSLVRGTGDTFAALTRNEAALQNLIVKNDEVFRTLAGRREALAQSIQVFPTFLRESRATLARLQTFSRNTEPLVRDLAPVLRDAQPTLASLRTLAPDLRALFTDLRPLINASRAGFPALSRVLRGLDPTLASIGPFLEQINPLLEYLELNQVTVSNFLNTGASALALRVPAAAGSGTNGHALPQIITLGSQSLPAASRSADNRGNAYLGPQALDGTGLKDPSKFSIPSFDCKATGGDHPPGSSPGCYTQGPIPFQGRNDTFPKVEPSTPSGASRNPRP